MWKRPYITSTDFNTDTRIIIMPVITTTCGVTNDDKVGTTWWRHQMETFSALLALCAGEFTAPWWTLVTKAMQWRGALMFSLICAWTNDWVNNRDAGDLRGHRAHHDVIVIINLSFHCMSPLALRWHHTRVSIHPHSWPTLYKWFDIPND